MRQQRPRGPKRRARCPGRRLARAGNVALAKVILRWRCARSDADSGGPSSAISHCARMSPEPIRHVGHDLEVLPPTRGGAPAPRRSRAGPGDVATDLVDRLLPCRARSLLPPTNSWLGCRPRRRSGPGLHTPRRPPAACARATWSPPAVACGRLATTGPDRARGSYRSGHRRGEHRRRLARRLVDRADHPGGHVRGDRPLRVQRADQVELRSRLHALRRPVHAGRGLHAAEGRPHPHRRALRALVGPDAGHRRRRLLRALLLPGHAVHSVRGGRRGAAGVGGRRAHGAPDHRRGGADVCAQGHHPADRGPPGAAAGARRADPVRTLVFTSPPSLLAGHRSRRHPLHRADDPHRR